MDDNDLICDSVDGDCSSCPLEDDCPEAWSY